MDLKLLGTIAGGYIIYETGGTHGTDNPPTLTWLSLEDPGSQAISLKQSLENSMQFYQPKSKDMYVWTSGVPH